MVTAFILMVTTPEKEREVIGKLLAMPEVKEAYVVYGEYDFVVKVETNTLKNLDQFITEKIRCMPEIQITSTMIAISI